jgi:hypothetical protein
MSATGPVNAVAADRQTRSSRIGESLLLSMALYGLVRTGQALAGDQGLGVDAALKPDAEKSPQHIAVAVPAAPFVSTAPMTEPQVFSPTEFRPRRHGIMDDADARSEASIIDAPMLKDTVARQLAEFKSQHRVRLLTLWQTRGSSLSLQAGRRGAPSLQWSTPWMHHNSVSRGLFDGLLAVSPRGFGGVNRGNASRQSSTAAPAKLSNANSP